MTRKQRRDLLVYESSCHLSTTHGRGFTLSLLIAERQAWKLSIPIFIVFGLTPPEIKPKSNVSVTDAVSTRPLIGNLQGQSGLYVPSSSISVPPSKFNDIYNESILNAFISLFGLDLELNKEMAGSDQEFAQKIGWYRRKDLFLSSTYERAVAYLKESHWAKLVSSAWPGPRPQITQLRSEAKFPAFWLVVQSCDPPSPSWNLNFSHDLTCCKNIQEFITGALINEKWNTFVVTTRLKYDMILS